ncbi:MAG: MBL fold metallo-hydrolase [Roseovarius sp.]
MTPPDDFDPPIGVPQTLEPGIQRIVAPNPSPMTYRGTNTYLLGQSRLAVIDPGPDDASHLSAILGAVQPGQTISHIFVTHAHLDHSPLAARLSAHTGAPVLAYGDHLAGRSAVMHELAQSGLMRGGEGVDHGFVPDQRLHDGETVHGDGWSLRAHWTPGHFGNHMCFASDDAVFVGDLVMGWASSLVSPPDGDLTDFMASCRAMQAVKARVMYAGHGAPITDPAARLDWLITHRHTRETAILSALAQGPATPPQLTALIYTDTPAALRPAATRNVLAHLVDLTGRGLTQPDGALHHDTLFALCSMAQAPE